MTATSNSPSASSRTLLLGDPLTGKTTRLVDLYRQHLQRGVSADKILCLSFFSANAQAIQQALKTGASEFFASVTTLQRFQTLLLRDHAAAARLPARALAVRQAWAEVDSPPTTLRKHRVCRPICLSISSSRRYKALGKC